LLRDDLSSRREYFEGALDSLSSCPIVFFDPDNGIEVLSIRVGSRDSSKYIYWREIERTYAAGHSMVIYQHFARVDRQVFTAGLAGELSARLNAPRVDSFRTPHVVFFLIARPEHAPAFERAHGTIHERWGNQIQASAHVAA
jgi:hypothetical protein